MLACLHRLNPLGHLNELCGCVLSLALLGSTEDLILQIQKSRESMGGISWGSLLGAIAVLVGRGRSRVSQLSAETIVKLPGHTMAEREVLHGKTKAHIY